MRRGTVEYLVEHVRHALATDARTFEQGVEVRLADGVVIVLGQVATEQRRVAVHDVVQELAGERPVRDELVVAGRSPSTRGSGGS